MKKRKTMALLLAAVMLLSALAACGGGDSSGDNQTQTNTGAANPGGNGSGSGASSGSGQVADENSASAYDVIELTFSTTHNENETAGQLIRFFTNYVTENSGGAVTFRIHWGGTVAGRGEELSFLQSGAIDMSLISQDEYSDVLPLLLFPGQAEGSQQICVDYFNHILFENSDTSSLIQSQIESNGIIILSFNAGGGGAFASRSEITDLAELTRFRLGVGRNVSAYESLGFTVQTMLPWDAYDSLSRGIADIAYMSMAPMVSLNWHEVVPYFLSSNTFTAGSYYTMGLARWNNLSGETQALFREAASAATAYSVGLIAEQELEISDTLANAGGKLSVMNADDSRKYADTIFIYAVADCRALAQTANLVNEMETILVACAQFLGSPLE